MKISLVALLASFAIRLFAASPTDATVAVFYSFDTPAPVVVFTEMQSELDRILGPSGVRLTWRSTDNSTGEDFPDLVVFRFQGRCTFDGEDSEHDAGAVTLAQTEIVDSHVLPFGRVNCDAVRHLIAPASRSLRAGQKNAALGRALARVSAHEIYHMLTGSESHAGRGIARAAHSSADLTAASFTFAETETAWLRSWREKHAQPARSLPSDETQIAVRSAAPDDSTLADFGGR